MISQRPLENWSFEHECAHLGAYVPPTFDEGLTEYFLCYSRTKRRLFEIENYHREVFPAKERRHSDEWHWLVCPTPRHFTATNHYHNHRPANNNTVVVQSVTLPPSSSQQHHCRRPVSNTTAVVQSTTPLSLSSQQYHHHCPVNNTTIVQSTRSILLACQQSVPNTSARPGWSNISVVNTSAQNNFTISLKLLYRHCHFVATPLPQISTL